LGTPTLAEVYAFRLAGVVFKRYKTKLMKIHVIKLMGFVLLAGFIATGCERTYYVGRGPHRHHDNGLHLGDRHNHNKQRY